MFHALFFMIAFQPSPFVQVDLRSRMPQPSHYMAVEIRDESLADQVHALPLDCVIQFVSPRKHSHWLFIRCME